VLSSAIKVTFAIVLDIVLREDNEVGILPRQSYRLHVCFGSLADLFTNSSLMSGFGRKADIEWSDGGQEKPGTWPGFRFLGSGGAFAIILDLYAEPFPLVA